MTLSFYLKRFSVLLVSLSFLLFENCNQSSPAKTEEAGRKQDTHLGDLMGHMQYEFIKLGLALQHNNQGLANFYMHEVNEAYEDIVSAKIMDGSTNISEKITQIFPTKSRLQDVIAKNDTANFRSAYHALVVSCNNCHMETNRGFIVIEEPREDFNGQNFSVQRSLYTE